MKKILAYVTLALITLVFTACNATQVTTSAPTNIQLPTTLAHNEDALYYNKLLNQYIADENSIPIVDDSIKEASLNAYKEYKKNPIKMKALLNIPKDATSGKVVDNQNLSTMAGKKAATTNATKTVVITYHSDTKEEITKKYNELSTMFKQMLPVSQKWRLTDDKSTAKIFHDRVVRMEAHYNKYKGEHSVIRDPKSYQRSIQQYIDFEENALKYPYTQLGYVWNSKVKATDTDNSTNMPNTLNINIRLANSKDQ